MPALTRREFLRGLGNLAAYPVLSRWLHYFDQQVRTQSGIVDVYVARNGTPETNVQRVVQIAGGIEKFIGYDDVVVLKPNGQWPNQGYTHTQSIKGLIDVILNRPGGFAGEIILMEHVHRNPTETMAGSYCWNMSVSNRVNNWSAMSYNELMADYHNRGISIVNADPLYDSGQGNYMKVTGPSGVTAGNQGWVHTNYTASNGRVVGLSHPILRIGSSPKLIDLQNGVWQGGSYTGQKVKLIFLPTLNNHGGLNSEDYAGPTSALKTHIGVVDFAGMTGGATTLHGVGYNSPISPTAMGDAVGQLITQEIHPVFYLTIAEYTGHRGRTNPNAVYTATVGLSADPVTLDYWMCKYVMYPCDTSQTFMNPDNDFNLRKALVGCNAKGIGTLTEANMAVHISDLTAGNKIYFPSIRRS